MCCVRNKLLNLKKVKTAMKKTYIAPLMEVEVLLEDEMLATSITGIAGDSGMQQGTGDVPTDADVSEQLLVW